jgi:SAM-dependent methyltransferase
MTPLNKLNLGCGESRKEGYVNVDWNPLTKPDVTCDLNRLPYPFADGQFDLIEAWHVLEHLDKPFDVMRELHRILKPGGILHIKVPHFSRGFTHAEHCHGFDVTFPLYFDKSWSKSGYFGVDFELKNMSLQWMAFLPLVKNLGYGWFTMWLIELAGEWIDSFARLSPHLCSRIWCYWVGGFDEIEFLFRKP